MYLALSIALKSVFSFSIEAISSGSLPALFLTV